MIGEYSEEGPDSVRKERPRITSATVAICTQASVERPEGR